MKVVMPSLRPEIVAYRQRTGADKWDEMWEGVLHMPPMPSYFHQELEGSLETYLRVRWARPRRAKVCHQVNLASVGGWPHDYRIPDLVLLMPDRFDIIRGEYLEGAPNVVVEIRSPGDESLEKLSFYAQLGVPEVWIIDRDTREPEIHLLKRGRYKKQRPTASGWVRSPATGIELRRSEAGKLAVRLAGDESTREDLPEE
jgi:Uma2 family endonuclease